MTLGHKLASAAAVFGVGAIAAGLLAIHFEQLGAAKVEARDAKIALAAKQHELEQVQRDAKTNEAAVNDLQAERERLAAAVAAVPAPVIRMCVGPASGGSGLPAAAGAAGAAREAATEGGQRARVPLGDSAGVDVGPGVQLLAVGVEQLSAQLRAILAREEGLRAQD